MRTPIIAASVLALILVALEAPRASAQGAVRDLPTSRFGNWVLVADRAAGLQISNLRSPRAVRLKLTAGSNGWFLLETHRGQFIMWTAGNFSTDTFSFAAGKPPEGAPQLAPGSYVFGNWQVQVTATDLQIHHSANPHHIRLIRSSDGWIEIIGVRARPTIRVGINDTLASP